MEEGTWKIDRASYGSGATKVKATDQWDPLMRAALKELGRRETERTGQKISVVTLLANLSVRNGSFAIEKRKELRQILIQLKKENTHGRRDRTSNT
ncbi:MULTISPECIES: hypothetical protein [unclassified Rathayibacter]|uniref:hypothetical protein n=1 Tax=unclassified Rathayibacter TaxID=2609250 RepID=UPI0011B02652|nr:MULTISPECIES: hypothetical protein [unclassified Rathayibacter]QHC73796.1 hypothetical protein GSU40_08970 [Rathayibacter sp. VKM Ac-2805]